MMSCSLSQSTSAHESGSASPILAELVQLLGAEELPVLLWDTLPLDGPGWGFDDPSLVYGGAKDVTQHGQAYVQSTRCDSGFLALDESVLDQLVANLVETDIPQDGGPEVDVPGLGLQGLERLSAQGVLSLEVFLSVRI